MVSVALCFVSVCFYCNFPNQVVCLPNSKYLIHTITRSLTVSFEMVALRVLTKKKLSSAENENNQ